MWRKSRRSAAGNCIEVDNGDWRTSSRSTHNGACVDVASGVRVRDTKQHGTGPVLSFTPEAWQKFTGQVKLQYKNDA